MNIDPVLHPGRPESERLEKEIEKGEQEKAELIARLSALTDEIDERTEALESAMVAIKETDGIIAESAYIRDSVLPAMSALRIACDEAETLTAKEYWPFPTYADLLFSVQ